MEVAAHRITYCKLTINGQHNSEPRFSSAEEKVLEAILDRPVTSFAFPFGSSSPEIKALSVLARPVPIPWGGVLTVFGCLAFVSGIGIGKNLRAGCAGGWMCERSVPPV